MNRVIIVVLVAAGAAGAGWYFGTRTSPAADAAAGGAAPVASLIGPRELPPYEDELPTFAEPGEGEKAPSTEGMGQVVGVTKLEEARTWARARGIQCEDTSPRALMTRMREHKQAELEQARAEGKGADAVSGASILYKRAKHEKNPQVRLSCEEAAAGAIGDRPREGQGRLLLVFDSAGHPLRHVSFQRRYEDHAAAVADVKAMLAHYGARFGAPTSTGEPLPEGEAPTFPKFKPVLSEWKFRDLAVKVSALYTGGKTVSVSESIEVPWPVRSDAPAL